MTDLVSNYLMEERDKTKYLIDSIVDMEINYLFTNDYDYLNNFTTFIPKSNKPSQNNMSGGNDGKNQGNNNMNNDINPQPPIDAKNIFIKEIRNRIEAYFKLIVRNLRDSVPKIMGNYLVKEIEENMQLKLYNKLYNAREMTDLLSEPESVAERRKELNDMIKVMRNAQKIIRRDPDLMTVMQININDSDITNTAETKKKEEPPKKTTTTTAEKKDVKPPVPEKTKVDSKPKEQPDDKNKKKKGYGNLFG
jgi:dynamin 1-like protein